jgi:hypothetical protein
VNGGGCTILVSHHKVTGRKNTTSSKPHCQKRNALYLMRLYKLSEAAGILNCLQSRLFRIRVFLMPLIRGATCEDG